MSSAIGANTDAALYMGEVMHRRTRPKAYEFVYRVFNLYIDIDRLDAVSARLKWFSRNRFNLLSFHDRDHGPRDGSSLRDWIERHLDEAGLGHAAVDIRLLCMPRVLGYGFDPLSIWYCHDASGALRAVLYEVKNTFGDQHGYLLPVDAGTTGPVDHIADKIFHVSPLIAMNARYRLRVETPGDTLAVLIRESDEEGEFLVATLTGARREMTDRACLRAFASVPLMSFKIIAAIHWHAVKLLLRGARFHRRPTPPGQDVSQPAKHQDAA